MRRLRTRQGDTVSNVLLRAYNRNDDDVEEALHIENPDLASLGPILPINTLIVLPEIQQQTVSEVVNVWD